MKISRRCDYAIRSMIYLCLSSDKSDPVGVLEIAKEQNIPLKFLSAILFELKKAKYISSKKGPGGGYRLECNPNDINIEHVIKLIDGEINQYAIDFSSSATSQSVNSSQVVKEVLDEIEKETRLVMQKLTLKELTTRYLKLCEEDIDYSI